MKQYCVLQPIETVTGECSTTMTAVVAEAGAHCLVVVPAPGESVSCQDLNSYAVSFTILQVCYADIEPSGVVDVDDLLLVINSWGSCEKCVADLMPLATGNGVVNVDDLLAVINSWGTCN